MTEIEAKFLIRRPEQVEQALDALDELGYDVAEQATKTHVDTYFDTRDWSIFAAGWTLRCRQRDDDSKLTLKSLGRQQGDVFVREEVEQALPGAEADRRRRLPAGPVREILDPVVAGAHRRKLFSVKSRRTAYQVTGRDDPGVRFEIDVDQTRIRARKAHRKALGLMEFTELELELRAGDPTAIDALAAILRERIGLNPALMSKFERGIQTAGLTLPGPRDKAPARQFRGKDSFLELLFDYLDELLDIIRRQHAVVWEGLDPEGVHKMRVTIRRLRALLRTFRDVFGDGASREFDRELRWLARQLGKARDADVCEMEIERFNAALPAAAAAAAAPYAEFLRNTTIDAYTELAEVLESERYVKLLAALETMITSGPDNAAVERFGGLSAADCARTTLQSLEEKFIRRGDQIERGSPATRLHKLRIRAKRLRYVLDFFSIAQPNKWQAPIAALQKLQDLLGAHQDAITAIERLGAFADSVTAEESNRELLLATGRLLQRQDDRLASCRRRFPATWSRFKKSLVGA